MTDKANVLAVVAAILGAASVPFMPSPAPLEVFAGLTAEERQVASLPLAATCSPEKPTAAQGETIRLKAWAISPVSQALEYAWTATAGRLDGEGSGVRWGFKGVRPGPHTATVRISERNGAWVDCSMQVIIGPPPARGLPRESGWSFLAQAQPEAEGYGLYSYLLLGSPASDAAGDRHRTAIEAYWGLMPDIASLERYVPRRELNVAYLPIVIPPGPAVTAEWVLRHYDYARSRALLRTIPGTHREGPYIVSSLKPLGGTMAISGEYLLQDLSAVPPPLVASWVKEFLNQAAQERVWEGRTAERLALRLRTTIGILALGLPDVRKGLESWIAWVR